MTNSVERIEHRGELLAMIIRSEFRTDGVHFFTPGDLSQQLGYMRHPKGKIIEPHVHNEVVREVQYTQEVLVIKSGKLRVDFYSADREYFESRILGPLDVILLIKGGHGFEVLEPIEMLEVKQGPYIGEHDKTRFEGISQSKVKVID